MRKASEKWPRVKGLISPKKTKKHFSSFTLINIDIQKFGYPIKFETILRWESMAALAMLIQNVLIAICTMYRSFYQKLALRVLGSTNYKSAKSW